MVLLLAGAALVYFLACMAYFSWRKTREMEGIAKIRREARARALDEMRSLMWGQEIESGVGVDVETLWKLVVLQAKGRQ
jgi:hypothetical protein